jgi:hypothetical protein
MKASYPSHCDYLRGKMLEALPGASSMDVDLYVVVSLPVLLEKARASSQPIRCSDVTAATRSASGGELAQSPGSRLPITSRVVLDLTADSDCDDAVGSDGENDVDADRDGSNDSGGDGVGADGDSVLSSDSGTTVDEEDLAAEHGEGFAATYESTADWSVQDEEVREEGEAEELYWSAVEATDDS